MVKRHRCGKFLKTLQRRRDFLKARTTDQKATVVSFDLSEIAALNWAIEVLSELLDNDKDSVQDNANQH